VTVKSAPAINRIITLQRVELPHADTAEFSSVPPFRHNDRDSDLLRFLTCKALRATYRRVLDWMIGFINILLTNPGLQAIQRYR
jgi:hypothetical protein